MQFLVLLKALMPLVKNKSTLLAMLILAAILWHQTTTYVDAKNNIGLQKISALETKGVEQQISLQAISQRLQDMQTVVDRIDRRVWGLHQTGLQRDDDGQD